MYMRVCVCICMYIPIYIGTGGWETAPAVEHVLKKGLGAVAPCMFFDQHYHKICRAKSNHFEGITWFFYRVLWVWDDGRFSL